MKQSVAILAVLLGSSACEVPEPEPEAESAAQSEPVSNCVPVSAAKLDDIASGLSGVRGGGSLRDGWAVRSGDMYYVAAELDGPGLEGDGHDAVWLTGGVEQFQGPIFSVDGTADEFSDWGPRGSSSDDGAREALECLRDAQRGR